MADTSTALNQYLTFTLGEELFAIDIGSVREILDDKKITKVPRTPNYMRGVLNLRGHAVPVVDLRQKFGMAPTEMTVNTCVIITEISLDNDSVIIGALADSVQEVLEIEPNQIDPPPRMGTAIGAKFIHGMGKRNERFIMILNIDQVFEDADALYAAATQ